MTNHIHINARRWFDKVNGNTYHSVSITMPDGSVKTQGLTYGYGRQYEQTAIELITGIMGGPRYENDNPVPPWRWYQEHGYTVSYDVAEVTRKKDLHQAPTEGQRASAS